MFYFILAGMMMGDWWLGINGGAVGVICLGAGCAAFCVVLAP